MILGSSFIQLGIQLYYSHSFPLPYHAFGLFGGRRRAGRGGELNIGEEFVVLGWDGGVVFLFGFFFFSGTIATAAAHIQHCHDSHFVG